MFRAPRETEGRPDWRLAAQAGGGRVVPQLVPEQGLQGLLGPLSHQPSTPRQGSLPDNWGPTLVPTMAWQARGSTMVELRYFTDNINMEGWKVWKFPDFFFLLSTSHLSVILLISWYIRLATPDSCSRWRRSITFHLCFPPADSTTRQLVITWEIKNILHTFSLLRICHPNSRPSEQLLEQVRDHTRSCEPNDNIYKMRNYGLLNCNWMNALFFYIISLSPV